MIDAEFEFFEVSILIEYLFVPYWSSNSIVELSSNSYDIVQIFAINIKF
jgi:hypothetical protein